MRHLRAFAAAAAMIGALAVAPASANAAYWVGLGDSFAAGPLIPSQTLTSARLPALDAQLRAARVRPARRVAEGRLLQRRGDGRDDDAAVDLRRHEPAAVRLDRRRHAGRLAADRRQRHRLHRDPHRTARRRTRSGARARTSTCGAASDELRNRIAATAPKVAAVLDGHPGHARAARILVLNYEAILPSSGSGCWPQVPIAWADVPYVRGIQLELNKMIASQASRARRTSSSWTTTRRASARTRARAPARAGSSRWCRATPRRRSTPMPGAWRE